MGVGEVGYNIATKLVREKADVILIDQDRERLALIGEALDVQTIHGSGADPATLIAANLLQADLLVAVTGSDETNILSCRLAQLLAPSETRRVARIRASGFYDFFDEKRFYSDFGINFTINPSFEAVETIMDFIEFPGLTDVIEVAKGRLHLAGLKLPQRHHLLNKPLVELLPRGKGLNILLVAVYRHHDLLIPSGNTILCPGDLVYVAAAAGDVDQVRDFYGLGRGLVKRLFIIGGGEVGYQLARRLEADGRDFGVKLVELNQKRCEYLSTRLSRTMVIHGDGTDQDLLLNENVDDADLFIAVSTDDERNLISCLIAKRLGAKQTITRVNRFSYAPLVQAIGLGAMVSARVAAVSAVLKYIRKGQIISVATLVGEEAEIIEFKVPAYSRVAGKKLMEIKFPAGSLVAVLSRGEEIIVPRGGTKIEAEDVLAVLIRPEAIYAVEKLLGAK